MGLKIDGITISKSADSSQTRGFNYEPVEIDLFRLPNKTSGIFTYPTFSADFVYNTLEFEDKLLSDGWTVSNSYTAVYDDGAVSFALKRVTSDEYHTHKLSLSDFWIDFSKINSAVTVSVPIKEAEDSAGESISYIQIQVGYTDKKTMFICIRQFISIGHMEYFYATDAWNGSIQWLEGKHRIEQDTTVNGNLTVNENATFQKDLSVDGTLHLGSELIGMGYKVYDMNYEGTEKDFSNASRQNIFTITNGENLIGVAVYNLTFKGYKDFTLGDDVNVEFSIPQNVFLAEGMEFKYSFKIGAGDHAATLVFKENILKLHLTCTYTFDTFSITGKVAGIYLPGFN